MNETYYTVEQIAKMLDIHPKTIQRYIREGRLRASKIGKSWRVSGHDLSMFAEGSKASDSIVNKRAISPEDRVMVSSVVDINVGSRDEAIRIVNALTASLNAKPPEYGRSTMHAQFLESEYKVRVTLWGGAKFMEAMISAVVALTQPNNEEEI